MDEVELNRKRGLLALLGCILADISVGEFNLLSFLYPYFSSYFHSLNPNITPKDMSWLPCIWLLTQILTGPLSIYVYQISGFRKCFFLFVTLFFIQQLICSLIENFYLFAVVYGVLGGAAQGGLSVLPLYCCWRYFPESQKSLVSGAILSAYALAPIGTSVIAQLIVNPENKSPVKREGYSYFEKDIYSNVPRFLRFFGSFCFAIGVFGIWLIKKPLVLHASKQICLEEISQPRRRPSLNNLRQSLMEGAQKPERKSSIGLGHIQRKPHLMKPEIKPFSWEELKIISKSEDFKQLYIVMFIGFLFPNYMLFNFKQIGLDNLDSADRFLNFAGSFAALFNGGSRFLLGMVYQKFGFLNSCRLVSFIIFTSSFSFMMMANTKFTFLLSLCYFFMSYGGQLGLYPLAAHSIFNERGALAYSLLFSAFSLSCLCVSFVHHFLTAWLGLSTVMMILGVLSLPPLYFARKIDIRIQARQNIVGGADEFNLIEKS